MAEPPRWLPIPGLPLVPGLPTGPGGLPSPSDRPDSGGTPPWLQERLFGQRAVFLTGALDDATATRAAASSAVSAMRER